MYDKSIFANQVNFDKFLKKPTVKAIDEDLAFAICPIQIRSIRQSRCESAKTDKRTCSAPQNLHPRFR